MRLIAVAASMSLVLAAVGCKKTDQAVLNTASTKTVKVEIVCEGDSVRALVSPFNIQIAEYDSSADEISWELSDSSTVDSMTITKKSSDSKKWPYGGSLPIKAKKKEAGKSGKLKKGTVDGRYGYNIAASCKLSSGDANIVIDPDMIIIHRTQ